MNEQLTVSTLKNDVNAIIKTLQEGKMFAARLVDWSMVYICLNEVEEDYTLVLFDMWGARRLRMGISTDFLLIYFHNVLNQVAQEIYEIIDCGEIASIDDCYRIMFELPNPKVEPDFEKITNVWNAFEKEFKKV